MASDILLRAYPDLLFAWHRHSLLVTDRAGAIAGAGLPGLYERDVRLLSRHRLLVHGRPPRLDALSGVAWLIQAILGLWTYAPLHAVIIEPELPTWLPELTLRDLRVGDGRLSIAFRRRGERTDYRVLDREGPIRVLRQPPPQDLRTRPIERLRELVESLLPGH